MPDDEKKKDIGEVVSVLLNLNDQNRQLMLFGSTATREVGTNG